MLKTTLSTFLALATISSVAAQTAFNVLLDDKKPSVYLEFVRIERQAGKAESGAKETFLLRLHNNTAGALSIPTESLHLANVHPLTVRGGTAVLALDSGREFDPCYRVEEFSLVTRLEKEVRFPTEPDRKLNIGPSCHHGPRTWLGSGDSFLLRVPAEHLEAGRRILIPFEYEWEPENPDVEHFVTYVHDPARREDQ